MRKRFEQQLEIGSLLIKDARISLKCRDSLLELMAALKEIFMNATYNEKVFSIIEQSISSGKKRTGRNGMSYWQIFVLAEVRLCLNASYDKLHYIANHDKLVRQILGVEKQAGFEQIEFEYQNIYDNVTLLEEEVIRKINEVIVEFGHDVFKKKEQVALR
jgi:transposase, IS5 family